MADADTNADIKAFLKAAGVEQYTDKLLEEGFDSLSTMLLLARRSGVAGSQGGRQHEGWPSGRTPHEHLQEIAARCSAASPVQAVRPQLRDVTLRRVRLPTVPDASVQLDGVIGAPARPARPPPARRARSRSRA